MTLDGLTHRFPDEDSCRAHFFRLRWPDGKVACPRCGEARKVYVQIKPEHPLLRLMDELRQETAHRSVVWIYKAPHGAAPDPDKPNETFTFGGDAKVAVPGETDYRALPLCRRWLALMKEIQYELGIEVN